MRTGAVDVNGGAFNPLAPFGGYKQSGIGRELGALRPGRVPADEGDPAVTRRRSAHWWCASAGARARRSSELRLPEVGPGQVRVRIRAAGVCHSDLSMVNGTLRPPYPLVLGHEAAGEWSRSALR